MNGSLPLPPVLSTKLSDFRRRVWMVKLAEGILAAASGLAVSYLLVAGLDRFFDTPAWLRGLILTAGALVPGLGLPMKWHKWVWRQRRLEDAARLLRWKFPRLGDQLLGIVELAKEDSAVSGRSERLVQAAMAQADEAVKDQDFTQAVPQAKHRQWGWAAAATGMVVVGGFIAANEAAQNALVRWLMPWRDTERYTFARIEPPPNPLVVPLAEPFVLPLNMLKESKWRSPDAVAVIDGQPDVSATMNKLPDGGKVHGTFELKFPPQKKDAEIFLKVGDVRETIVVQPRPRPELTSLNVQTKLPEYLQYKTQPVLDIRGGTVSVLKGAEATFTATASRNLTSAWIDGAPAKVEAGKLISPTSKVETDREVKFEWKDELGLTARVPVVLKVQGVGDEAPRLMARRDSLEQVVLDSEVVTFDVSASDDFGVKQMGLEWRALSDGTDATLVTTLGTKVAAAGEPEGKELSGKATFCATREDVKPQSLEIHAWAEDYLPGRDRSKSAAFVIHVLNQTDHAMWVTQQMNKWLEAAKEAYEREQQLYVTNKELRAMDAADLDRPENRRRVAQQSILESANAERLNALNNAGRQLAEHATKNPEFDAKRLESWATMLRSLQDISSKRMPNVADLLKQSADAKADAKPGQNSGGNPNPSVTQQNPSGQQDASPEAGDQKPSDPNAKPSQQSPGDQKPGDQKPSDSQTSSQSPPGEQDPNAKPSEGPKTPSAPILKQGPQDKPSGKPSETDPNAKPPAPAPAISIKDGNMFPKEEPKADDAGGGKKPPAGGSLTLPGNSLASPPGGEEKPEPSEPESSAQKPLDEGIQEQKELLEEFAKVSDQLSEILASLEASTFVKRLKAASRKQQELAGEISKRTLDAFGVVRDSSGTTLGSIPVEDQKTEVEEVVKSFLKSLFPGKAKKEEKPAIADAKPDGEREESKKDAPREEAPFVTAYAPIARGTQKSQSDVVKVIQGDLEAYFERKPTPYFKRVLGEMKDTRITEELKTVGQRAADNLSGTAIHGSEYWADTLDRWAEEMVKAAEGFT